MKVPHSTLEYLKALKENNNREWFNDNRESYELERKSYTDFTQLILDGLSKLDKRISTDLSVSKCIFRIYRDIRFSKDKTPYKGYFSAAFSSTGRSTNLPGYYFHLEPGSSFITAGLWHPEKEKLAAIRQEIDYNSEKLHAIIDNPQFKKQVSLDQEDKLKKAPSGYSTDHPDIDFLRLKSFTASRMLEDSILTNDNAIEEILKTFSILQPFQEFLYEAIEDI